MHSFRMILWIPDQVGNDELRVRLASKTQPHSYPQSPANSDDRAIFCDPGLRGFFTLSITGSVFRYQAAFLRREALRI